MISFVRNDMAYYQAVLCNRKSDSEDYAAMKDFGDLNGDVGKQWMALYTLKNGSGSILADSLKVVTVKREHWPSWQSTLRRISQHLGELKAAGEARGHG